MYLPSEPSGLFGLLKIIHCASEGISGFIYTYTKLSPMREQISSLLYTYPENVDLRESVGSAL